LSDFDTNGEDLSYELRFNMYPLQYMPLILNFAFPVYMYWILFIVIGALTVAITAAYWLVVRLTTILQAPPDLRLGKMLVLVLPPPAAGVTLGLIPIIMLTIFVHYIIHGTYTIDIFAPTRAEPGDATLDSITRHFSDLDAVILEGSSVPVPALFGGDVATPSDSEVADARTGRTGFAFILIALCCTHASMKMNFCKEETKRERDIAKLREPLASKNDIWRPTNWKKFNFFLSTFIVVAFCQFMVEFSFWSGFGDTYLPYVFLLFRVLGVYLEQLIETQLQELLLGVPLVTTISLIQGLVSLGSDDFFDFLIAYSLDVAMLVFERVYLDYLIEEMTEMVKRVFRFCMNSIKKVVPKYLRKDSEEEEVEVEAYKREIEGVAADDSGADSVEPILVFTCAVCSDTVLVFYFPYVIILLMLYRTELWLPGEYGIKDKDMGIYMYFQLFLIPFQSVTDVFIYSSNELFWGWKVYEYLVYSRYRFLQRETRWKGMEDSLDECIEESMRSADQMCFSSQFYMMVTIHTNGMLYAIFGMLIMFRVQGYPGSSYVMFGDVAMFHLLLFILIAYYFITWFCLFLAKHFSLWKTKHENTSWHLSIQEEDDLDLPGWEDVKGASHDAYMMNQRITSETFRYKFMNYNRSWLIHQLPQLLTPRTLRRSRPYLINQMARIIHARRDDISDDSDGDRGAHFGPVALNTASRQIIRWWLGKARRRRTLSSIVDPLIRKARGAECEQCLSRRQLQVEYEIDVETMSKMYDERYPDEEEVDQVQWKSFWTKNQRYHTICLACSTRRKETERKNALKGAFDDALLDDTQEAYPDWGPVYLSAASKAILLNWYRKAQRVRQGKKGIRRKKKVLAISDDEGDAIPIEWTKQLERMTPATKAIAIRWSRTARSNILKREGKGESLTEADLDNDGRPQMFKSGKKSQLMRK
jgi:hypothetical protein